MRALFGSLLCALVGGLAGCAVEPAEPQSGASVLRGTLDGEPAAVIRASGKLRDLTAAVNRALDTRELAVLQVTEADETGSRTYEIVGLRGESGVVRAEFPPPSSEPAAGRETREMTLSARLGFFGDPEREMSLLRALAGELELLAKRES